MPTHARSALEALPRAEVLARNREAQIDFADAEDLLSPHAQAELDATLEFLSNFQKR